MSTINTRTNHRPRETSALAARARPSIFAVAALLAITGCDMGKQEATMGFQATASNESQALLQKWCSGCHAAPRPSNHGRGEWRPIVLRMQQHRITKGLSPIEEEDLRKIIHYYQTHAPL